MRRAQWPVAAPNLRVADRFVASCQHEIDLYGPALGVAGERFRLIRDGADPLPVDPATVVPNGAPLVLSIGRLEHYKGHHRLVAAMPALLRLAPRAHLVIVGSGPYERHLRSMVSRLALGSVVSFATFAAHERARLGALVKASSVVALLSEYEAHPTPVMEALAIGKEVVVADTPGLSELGRAGLVSTVPLHAKPDEVARALQLGASTSRWVTSPPRVSTWDDCTAEVLDTYDELLHSLV